MTHNPFIEHMVIARPFVSDSESKKCSLKKNDICYCLYLPHESIDYLEVLSPFSRFNLKKIFICWLVFCTFLVKGATINEIAEPYFRAAEYQKMVLSPNGEYIAAETYYKAKEHVEIVDIKNNKSYVIFNGTSGYPISVSKILWIDNDTIILELTDQNSNNNQLIFKVIHLDFNEFISVDTSFEFTKRGYVIDGLPLEENLIYFAYFHNLKKNSAALFKLDLSNKKNIDKNLNFSHRLDKNISNVFYWLTDKKKRLKLTVSKKGDYVSYWLKKNHRWKKSYTVKKDSNDFVIPLSIDSENQIIVIKRQGGKDKKGVYILDATTFNPLKEIFYSNKYDVDSVDINPFNSNLLSLAYTENGIMKEIFFDEKLVKSYKLINEKYPNQNSLFISHNQKFNRILFFQRNFQNMGTYTIVDLETENINKIIQVASWQEKLDKAKLEVVHYQSDDGFKIESYLSVPQNKETKALIVMPHGGPIGVRSYGDFNALAHFFASYGIAVLKVNYRGSSGFGNKFQEAGNSQWGNKIEQDINEVVSQVLKEYNINENICSSGQSYGGYSALMLHINYPKRYKCIIAMASPSDLPLMFTSSDWNVNKESIREMIKIVGDPHKNLDKLKSQSPVYNAKKINAPVLLFHGTEDKRVSIQHSIRLEYVLNKLDKPVVFKKLEGVEHGLRFLVDEIFYAKESLMFINKSLDLQLDLK